MTRWTGVAAGEGFLVTDSTLNRGLATALGIRIRYFLSTNDRKGDTDRILQGARVVSSLAPSERSTGTVTVGVPVNTPDGSYHVIACADHVNAIPEMRENNNCLASSGRILVQPPAAH